MSTPPQREHVSGNLPARAPRAYLKKLSLLLTLEPHSLACTTLFGK